MDSMEFKKYFYLDEAFALPDDYVEANYNDLKNDLDHPNENSTEYWNMSNTYTPPKDFPRFYSSLDINSEGLFIMAANNYTTTVFDGVIVGTYNFNDFIEPGGFDRVPLKDSLQSNYRNVKILNDTRFLTTSQRSLMMYINKPCKQDLVLIKEKTSKAKHQISCLEILPLTHQVIVGTSKGNLELFNYNNNLDLASQIMNAHFDEVTSIAAHPTKEKSWATSSSDNTCVLWDNKQATPASFLIKHHRNRLTDVKWLNENLILVSDASGYVNLLDPRNPKVDLERHQIAERVIDTLTFDKTMKRFGVVSASPQLKIYEIDTNGQLKLLHEHSVRPNILYSMAWDPKEENTCYVVGDNKYAQKIVL